MLGALVVNSAGSAKLRPITAPVRFTDASGLLKVRCFACGAKIEKSLVVREWFGKPGGGVPLQIMIT